MPEKKQTKYRHELKYQVTDAQLQMLKSRINHLLPLDSHVARTGSYRIRSLYFDDYYDRCLKENENGTMYNLVGFQTHLTFAEQKRVFSKIPGLENATFLRYGVMHRNTFINAPKCINKHFQCLKYPKTFINGNIILTDNFPLQLIIIFSLHYFIAFSKHNISLKFLSFFITLRINILLQNFIKV